MTQSQQLRKLAARSATAFLLAALCVFPLYIDKFSNLGVVKFTGICTLSWAFALWLGALTCVGARPDPGRLPWKADPALWALGAVTASGVVSTVLSLSPGASFWGLGGYYGGCMMVLFTAGGVSGCPRVCAAENSERADVLRRRHDGAGHGAVCAQHL